MKRTTAYLLITTLLLTVASAYFPSTATASSTTLVWLTHWTEPEEVWYWGNVTKAYMDTHPGVIIDRHQVEFESLYETIMIRHAAGEDPDLIHIHAMWLPELANWKAAILAVPPSSVQADVRANWTDVTRDMTTWKGITWGYPTEFNSWALVYNRKLFQDKIAELTGADKTFLENVLAKLEADQPLNWTVEAGKLSELNKAAVLLTEGAPPSVTQTGFTPFVEGMPEEQRFQFLSMLWSNGGEYVNLLTPEALFDSTSGHEVMQLYHNLGFHDLVYDPLNLTDYWWAAWADETLAMIILPTWMTYVRDAMEANFAHLGVAPIPVGPSGSSSRSATYTWLNVVTKKAETDGRAAAAWDFLKWLNEPKLAGSVKLPGASLVGDVPKGDNVSIMGDYLIYDSIIPSRKTDQTNGRLTVGGAAGPLIKDDFWFAEFMKFGAPPYGRPDTTFLNAEEAQYEIGLMFETIAITDVADVPARVDQAAANIDAVLPMPGDANIDGIVDIYDAVLMVRDIDATPEWGAAWYVGRCDIIENNIVDVADITKLCTNYGKTGGY